MSNKGSKRRLEKRGGEIGRFEEMKKSNRGEEFVVGGRGREGERV